MHERKLKLGDAYDVYSRRNPWPDAARDLRLDPDELTERARVLAAAAPDVTVLERPLPNRLAELVAERAARCAALLD